MIRCICDIVCTCNQDTIYSPPSIGNSDMATVNASSVGACLLGKTRPLVSATGRDEQLNLFNIINEYRTYSYTLSPRTVGIMAGKSRDKQYQTLKRLHNEVLEQFQCSYIINIEVYPNNDNDLHCHGVIRFRSHNKKEEFKKLLKERITLGKKGTYANLIDCEFNNSFSSWKQYISKSQQQIIECYNYEPFIKIDYSFHIPKDVPITMHIGVSDKTRLKKIKDPEAYKNKLEIQLKMAQLKVDKLKSQMLTL